MPVLTLVDVLGIQRYVYATNRLRDVVGGSLLVDEASSRGLVTSKSFATDGELVFGAGGNLLLSFSDLPRARQFAAQYSRWLLDSAPGLEACIVHLPYDPRKLKDAAVDIRQQMQQAKMSRLPAGDLPGIGIEEPCIATGLPAQGLETNDDGGLEAISRGVELRRKEFGKAAKDCATRRTDLHKPLVYPAELDRLGRSSGEISLMGVVHIDGNGIGRRLDDWLTEFEGDDDQLKAKYREVSDGLSDLANRTFNHLEEKAIELIDEDGKGGGAIKNPLTGASFSLYTQDGSLCAPLRPILIAGDDLTFVCEGRLALALAAEGLRFFEAQGIPELGTATACAGVALVKTHAPFVRAYELSEALCRSAKKVSRGVAVNGQPAPSALDWQINLSSPSEIVDSIREAGASGLKMSCRPYMIESARATAPMCWKWMEDKVLTNQGHGFLGNPNDRTAQGWHRHRNKLKKLPELALGGPESVLSALEAWQVAHSYLQLPCGKEGFSDGATYLLDAVELLDIYYPLKSEEGDKAGADTQTGD